MHKMIPTSIIAIAAANFIVACSREQQQPPPESTTPKEASKDRVEKKSEPDAATAPADPMKSGY